MPCPPNAPPVATVCDPIGSQPFAGSGSISSMPAASRAFVFFMMMVTISSNVSACPTASLPAPAPMSIPAKSYRSMTRVAAPARDPSYCHPRFAWRVLTPLVSVSAVFALTEETTVPPSSSVFCTVVESWKVHLVPLRVLTAIIFSYTAIGTSMRQVY
jgi:hypothetical protein